MVVEIFIDSYIVTASNYFLLVMFLIWLFSFVLRSSQTWQFLSFKQHEYKNTFFLLFALVLLYIFYLSKNASCLSRYGDQIVAIKVLNGGNTSDERASLESRFVREVVMMSRVKHENLVKVSIIFLFLPSSLDSKLIF